MNSEQLPTPEGEQEPQLPSPLTFPPRDKFMLELLYESRLTRPLSAELYDRAFNHAFVPNSTEYRNADGSEGPMLYRTKEFLTEHQPHSVLSVGAGTGHFDRDIFLEKPLEFYCAVEPNPHHAVQIPQNLAGHSWNQMKVLEQCFDENFSPDAIEGKKVDLVLMTHCMYFMKDPVAVVRKAQSLLTQNGQVMILHQTHVQGVCPFYRHFEKRFGIQWDPSELRQDHAMSTETLSDDLKKAGISHAVDQAPAVIYVDDFFSNTAQARENQILLLSFFLNTDSRNFVWEQQQEMIEYVRSHSLLRGGRHEFDHPQGFITIPVQE